MDFEDYERDRAEKKLIRDYIAEDNEEYAAKTIKENCGKFENLQMLPGMGADPMDIGQWNTYITRQNYNDYTKMYSDKDLFARKNNKQPDFSKAWL